MNADKILFRASKCGNLMSEPKDAGAKKRGELSEGAKTFLLEIFIKEKYSREAIVESKYMTKGTEVENEALNMYAIKKEGFYLKNEEHFCNEYLKGTPDIIHGKTIIDLKSSWDIHTFFASKNKPINKLYYWQLQAYMALTDAEKAKLAYCLTNTPSHLISDEKRRLAWQMGILDEETEEYIQACKEVEKNGIYDLNLFLTMNPYFELHHNPDEWIYDVPLNDRVFEFSVERSQEDIEKLYGKAKEARKWINENLYKIPTSEEIALKTI